MSLNFCSLQVGSGDAFLLTNDDWHCLFDAGCSTTRIVELLKEKKIARLNLAICSHNDSDHANGFIGLLGDPSIQIDEIWLPGNWTSILDFVKDNPVDMLEVAEILRHFNGENRGDEEMAQDSLYGDDKISIDDFDDGLSHFSEYPDSSFHFGFVNHFYDRLKYDNDACETYGRFLWLIRDCRTSMERFVLNLDRIERISSLAYKKGCKIRWFEPNSSCKASFIDYGLVALNSTEISQVKRLKNTQALLFRVLTSEDNKQSLVFEYLKDGHQIVRFSADSDCTFQSASPYKGCIIVTAPHHGSEANSNVYKAIKGDDVIWVRSDRKSKKGPCAEFKRLKKKYCLACYHSNISGEICFVYRNDKWHRSKGYECNCHNSRVQEDMANISHPQAIDLGLPSGTKWASCNVGATKPEEFGGYFAWGETEEKTSYKWRTYIHWLGVEDNCKYLGSDIAGTEYDVAHVRWGGNWRMPTQKQFMELLKHCNHEWIPQNGVYGRKFTSKINGNSIFLPAAGFRGDSNLNDVSKGYYWSSIPYSPKGNSFFQSDSDMAGAEFLNFNSDDAIAMGCKYLRDGLTVRPVSR